MTARDVDSMKTALVVAWKAWDGNPAGRWEAARMCDAVNALADAWEIDWIVFRKMLMDGSRAGCTRVEAIERIEKVVALDECSG